MPGAGAFQFAVRGVDLGVVAGREAQVRRVAVGLGEAVEEVGGAGEHRVRAVALGSVGAQGDAQLAHQRGGPHVVSLDVADDQGEAAAGQRDHVVPVAADLEAAAGGDVAGGDVHAGDLRTERGQHDALQSVGQLPLGLGRAGPGQGLGEHPGHGGQDGAFVRCEGDRMGEGRHPGTHGATRHGQRQIGPGLAAEVLGEQPGHGVPGPVLLGGGEIDRAAGADHLGGRVVGAQRHVRERVRLGVRLPVVADDAEAVARHPEHREAVGREARHRQPGRDPEHLLGGARLGQCPAGVQQEGLPRAAPVAGYRAAPGGCAGRRFGDLLEGAGQLVRLAVGVEGGAGAAADHADDVAPFVHDADADLGEGALGDGEPDHSGDLVPVDRMQPGPYLRLCEAGRLGGEPEQVGGLRVHPDLTRVGVPVPQAGPEGDKDVSRIGQRVASTSAHCPTLGRFDRVLPLVAAAPEPVRCCRGAGQWGGSRSPVPGTLGLFHVKRETPSPIREGWMNDDASVQVPHLRRAPRL